MDNGNSVEHTKNGSVEELYDKLSACLNRLTDDQYNKFQGLFYESDKRGRGPTTGHLELVERKE